MNKVKQHAVVDVILFIVFAVLVVGTISKARPKVTVQPTCYQKLAELDVVAKIATATGVQPGVAKRNPIGTKYSVNKDYCK